MKRWLKILLIVLGVIVVMVFAAWLFRGPLLGHFLVKQVFKQSGGKVKMTVSDIDICLKDGDIYLKNPVFTFDTLNQEKNNQFKLKKISVDTVVLENLSFYELLWNKKFRARQLKIEKTANLF